MGTRGLLGRIETGDPRRGADHLDASIAEHLRVLLNSRRGGCATQPDFGIVDFTDVVHGFPGSIPALQQAIRATILGFEPRLRGVTVRHLPQEDPLTLQFEITAQPVERSGRGVLRFSTRMQPGGRIEVL